MILHQRNWTYLLGSPLEASNNTVLDLVQVLQRTVETLSWLQSELNNTSNPPELPLSSQSIGWVRWCQVRSTRSSCDCPFVKNCFLFCFWQRRVSFASGACDMPKPTKNHKVKAIPGDGISFLYHGCNATETRSFCRWLSMNIVQHKKV